MHFVKKLSKLVNFCVAILVLKMEEISNICSILCFIISRKVKTQLNCKKMFFAAYAEGAMNNWTHQQWFVKFRVVDFSLDSAPWWGKPVEVDGDQIETLIKNNQCYTMRETVDILKISASSIGSHLCQLGYVNCFDVCIPQKLSQKNLILIVFLPMILYLNVKNSTLITNCEGWLKVDIVKYCGMEEIGAASETNYHQPCQRSVFIQKRWCYVYGGIGRESFIMSFFQKNQIICSSTAPN